MVPDGKTDNSAAFQSCLDKNAPAEGSGKLAYVTIPPGAFLFHSNVTLRSHEIIIGSSTASTQLLWQPSLSSAKSLITATQYAGIAELSMKGPGSSSLFATSDRGYKNSGNSNSTGHFFVKNVDFELMGDSANGTIVSLTGPDIQVYGSTFDTSSVNDSTLQYSAVNLGVEFADGLMIAGNTFINDNGYSGVNGQNIIVESNTASSRVEPGPNGNDFITVSRPICAWCQSMMIQNVYIGYNNIENIGRATAEVITNDGGGGAYFGPVASSTDNTVTLAYDPSWIWTGNSSPQTINVAIVAGTGVGQYSMLKGWNHRTLNLENSWAVLPDSTSVVVVATTMRSLIVAHNSITNTLGMSISMVGTFDTVIEDNLLTNSGDGIRVSDASNYGGPQAYPAALNTVVLRNKIVKGEGSYFGRNRNYSGGIGIWDGQASLVSGLLIRDNYVNGIQKIYSCNGTKGISANLIEENAANWWIETIPGFLVQNNTAP